MESSRQSSTPHPTTLSFDLATSDSGGSIGCSTNLAINENATFSTTGLYSNCSKTSLPPEEELPPSLSHMSDLSIHCVIAYSIIFLISAGGNISVFFSVLKQLHQTRNRISLLILHLCIADLIVTFTAMPLEIVWRITIQWYGGDILCKLCQFMRAFGLYLSSMVVICISLDRYFAIIYPLKLGRAAERAKVTLGFAWLAALLCATPQTIIFHVEQHPKFPSFKQCVTESFVKSDIAQDLIYNVFSVSVLYFVPLLIILFTYIRIVSKISHKALSRGKQLKRENGFILRKNQQEFSVGYHIPQKRQSSITVMNSSDGLESETKNGMTNLTNQNQNMDPECEETGHESTIKFDDDKMTEMSPQPQLQLLPATTESGRKLLLRTSISGGVLMARAKTKTLRLTCVIVLTFVFCWTPYIIMTLCGN